MQDARISNIFQRNTSGENTQNYTSQEKISLTVWNSDTRIQWRRPKCLSHSQTTKCCLMLYRAWRISCSFFSRSVSQSVSQSVK